jgi:hypothetical protein
MDQTIIDKMLLAGAIEVAGLHKDTGEFLYSFTPQLKELSPEMSEHVDKLFYKTVLSLWEKGFINGNMEDADPNLTLTEDAMDNEKILTLTDFEQVVLSNIKDHMQY